MGTLKRAVWVSGGSESLIGESSKTVKRSEGEARSIDHSCGEFCCKWEKERQQERLSDITKFCTHNVFNGEEIKYDSRKRKIV